MRVLVTGAAGFVAKHVIEYLLAHTDWQIVGLDTHSRRFDSDRVEWVYHDLRTPINDTTMALFDGIDAVINLASSSDVPSFLRDPAKHTVNNVVSTLNLLEWARTQKLVGFIQVSTNEVYGPTVSYSHSEWSPLVPSTPYSASKASQEMLATGWWRTYGVPIVIVNTMHIYGEEQPRERFIPTAIDRILNGESVPIYGRKSYGEWRSSVRNWTYAGDFAHAVHWILTHPIDVAGNFRLPDRWNVAGPERSCVEVATAISERLGMPFDVEWIDNGNARPGYDLKYALNTTAFGEFGFKPIYGFRGGLERTVNWKRRVREEG